MLCTYRIMVVTMLRLVVTMGIVTRDVDFTSLWLVDTYQLVIRFWGMQTVW